MTLDQALSSTRDGVHSQDGTACVVGVSHEGWRVAFGFDTTSWLVQEMAVRAPEPKAVLRASSAELPLGKLTVKARGLAIAERRFPLVSATKIRLTPFVEHLRDGRGKPTTAADYVGLAVEFVLWQQRGEGSPARRFAEVVGGDVGTWYKRIERARKLGLWDYAHGQYKLTDLGWELAGGKYDHQHPEMVGRPVVVPLNPPQTSNG